MERPVNLLRATTTCNAFYIVFSAAKAALLPFLTLLFRLLGLDAMQTGIVMAAKTLTGFVWAPLWARCAVTYNKRRVVLLFSLLMMATMYLSFTAVYYKVAPALPLCHSPTLQDHHHGNTSLFPPSNLTHTHTTTQPSVDGGDALPSPHQPTHSQGQTSAAQAVTQAVTPGSQRDTTLHVPPSPSPSPSPSPHRANITMPHPPSTTTNALATESSSTDRQPSAAMTDLVKIVREIEQHTGQSVKELVESRQLSLEDLFNQARKVDPDITKEGMEKVLDQIEKGSVDSRIPAKRSANRVARNLNVTFLNNLKDGFSALTATLAESKLLLFLIVLLIVIFGEFFSSPVEKIADDAWFDFLERIDDMEKYGRQRYWGSLTFALVPIVVTCLVDYTPCRLVLNLHHFLLHLLVFGIFMVLTLLLACYFPMPPPLKHKYGSKVAKGLRVICCDSRGFLFTVSLLVAGAVYASFHNFLFWHLQDLGSGEVTMGLCVSIAAFAETPMLVVSNKLVRKLGHGGTVSLCLGVLAVRVLYYGFLWTPWAVLPMEVTNAFTHTALWYAVLSYDEFNMGSAMDRSIRSILSSMYFGLGFSLGSFVSGVVYHTYSAPVLFWGASVLSAAWCLLHCLVHCCLPKKERVKYIKLLRKDDEDTSEGDDDWLEMALKDQ
ncbi:major facilitator superfamily domain-containing protein 6-like protein B [Babylonia areolata]|uniref:major facilitator superfamily domain-containing protein 6-like protein B n=1 Tax=Babylonia areolata TaxID=304850 RepID=UPI003FD30934